MDIVKKIMHDELGQNDEIDKAIDECFEFLNKIQLTEPLDKLPKNPEILAFFQSKNVQIELLEYIVRNLDPSNKTCEEAVKEAIRLVKRKSKIQRGNEFELLTIFLPIKITTE